MKQEELLGRFSDMNRKEEISVAIKNTINLGRSLN